MCEKISQRRDKNMKRECTNVIYLTKFFKRIILNNVLSKIVIS